MKLSGENDVRHSHAWPRDLAEKITRAALERKLATGKRWTVTDEINDRLRASFAAQGKRKA